MARIRNQDNTFLRARRALLLDNPFFGSLVMHLEAVEDPSTKTMWVNGRQIGYNPTAIDALPLKEVAGLIAKGVLHCALGHHVRRGNRTQDLWQKACNYVTAPHILDSGLGLPEAPENNREYVEQNLSAEQVYRILKDLSDQSQEQQQGGDKDQGQGNGQGQGQGQGNGQPSPQGQGGGAQGNQSSSGLVLDMPGNTPGQAPAAAEQKANGDDWNLTMQQAKQSALMRGDLPASLMRTIEKALAPAVDWRNELRRFMTERSRDDLTWSRPNRRYIAQGTYLPSLHSETMGKVVFAVDTSGSITEKTLGVFQDAINAVCEETQPKEIHVIYCDAHINDTEEYAQGEFPIELRAIGGGGTKFEPVFEYVEEQDIEPACLIYLTDTIGTFPAQAPDYPVLWASVLPDRTCPFGETIFIDEDQDAA